MARVTIEDCISKVENRFELVLLAAQRSNDINSGAHITIERSKDKYPVIALREIALGNVRIDLLRQELIQRLQTGKVDKVDDENLHAENDAEEIEELETYVIDNTELYMDEDSELGDEIYDDSLIEDGED
jgi:DNA-directed RNA polymerase subunit omega